MFIDLIPDFSIMHFFYYLTLYICTYMHTADHFWEFKKQALW